MPTPTYTALATKTLTSTAASVTFSSIPATYQDLILIVSARYTGTATGNGPSFRVNGIATSDYFQVRTDDATSSVGTTAYGSLITESNSNYALYRVDFMNANSTDKHKLYLERSGANGTRVSMLAGRVATTNAITSIAIYGPDNFVGGATPDNWDTGSTFSLYGIIS